MTADAREAVVRLWYRLFLPVLLAATSLALVLAYLLTRPLRRLTEAAQRLGQGDYSVDVKVAAPGEVGNLASTFREMVSKTRQRERELRENLARMNTVLTNAADGIFASGGAQSMLTLRRRGNGYRGQMNLAVNPA